jgi:hypothetical protein
MGRRARAWVCCGRRFECRDYYAYAVHRMGCLSGDLPPLIPIAAVAAPPVAAVPALAVAAVPAVIPAPAVAAPLLPPALVHGADVIERLMLNMADIAMRHGITAVAMDDFINVCMAPSLLQLGALKPVKPVEGVEPAKLLAAPNATMPRDFGRWVAKICESASTLRRFAMCPDKHCGKLYKLDSNNLLPQGTAKCSRKLVSELIEWPCDEPRPAAVAGEGTCEAQLALENQPRRPQLIFTYTPLKNSLQKLLERPAADFRDKCEEWRVHYAHRQQLVQQDPNIDLPMTDVWDGRLWKHFQHWPARGAPAAAAAAAAAPVDDLLLARPGTLALSLNVDWYQTGKRGSHSQGLIWLSVQNLPRTERYELQNMILLGVLPGPGETSRTQLQGVLQLLCHELKGLFKKGLEVKALDGSVTEHRAFLFSVICDLPAQRATCGFSNANALVPCAYCVGWFPRRKQKKSSWPDYRPLAEMTCPSDMPHGGREARTDVQHRQWARAWARHLPDNPASAEEVELSRKEHGMFYGARWSVLYDLPYYDSIRCAPVDVMHNIYLGMCKHVLGLFKHGAPPPAPPAETAANLDAWRKSTDAFEKKKEAAVAEAAATQAAAQAAAENAAAVKAAADAAAEAAASAAAATVAGPAAGPAARAAAQKARKDADEAVKKAAKAAARSAAAAAAAAAAAEAEAATDLPQKLVDTDDAGAESSSESEGEAVPMELDGHEAAYAEGMIRHANKRKHRDVSDAQKACRLAAASAGAAAGASAGAAARASAAATAANSAAPAAAAAVGGNRTALFGDSHFTALQGYMDNASPPRDIGRIIQRLGTGSAKFSSLKAIEWLNWFDILAVPCMRELMHSRAVASRSKFQTASAKAKERKQLPDKPANFSSALNEQHFRIMLLTQRVVHRTRAHSLTLAEVGSLHTDVMELVHCIVRAFGSDNCITPNLHLSMHLQQQVRDFGPPAGWWCFGYERMNGLVAKTPHSRSDVAKSSATRAQQLLHIVGQLPREPVQMLPNGKGYEHWMRALPHNNGHQHVYRFTHDADGCAARENLARWRRPRGGDPHYAAPKGWEPWPGQLSDPHKVLLKLPSMPDEVDEAQCEALCGTQEVTAPHKELLGKLKHARDNLHIFYLREYQEDCMAYVNALVKQKFIPEAMPEARAEREDWFKRIELFKKRVAFIQGLPPSESKGEPQQLEQPEVQAWMRTFTQTAQVFRKLHIAGELYGSDCKPRMQGAPDSHICVWYPGDEGAKDFMHCGRVSFYLTHEYTSWRDKQTRVHHFAMARWFDYVGQANVSPNKAKNLPDAMRGVYGATTVAPLQTQEVLREMEQSFDTFPVITVKLTSGTTMDDLIPVHRIHSRWMSVKLDESHQFACPLPTRAH